MLLSRVVRAGPHLVELNETVRTLAETRNMRIVSAVEGQATQLSPVLPKVLIVPEVRAHDLLLQQCRNTQLN